MRKQAALIVFTVALWLFGPALVDFYFDAAYTDRVSIRNVRATWWITTQ